MTKDRDRTSMPMPMPMPMTWPAPAELPENVPWYTHRGSKILRSGDVGAIVRYYREFHRLTQTQLSEKICVDRTYVSHWETRSRRLDSIANRIALADKLGIPYASLGIADAGQQDHAEMLASGDSVVRLSRTAREGGRAADALRELDQLLRALERRACNGKAIRADMVLLAAARAEIGVALGDLLPEAHLKTAAQWTGSGVNVLASLEGEPNLSAHSLRMHGNELRKAGDLHCAVRELRRAVEISPDLGGRATASLLLARAASEQGNTVMFDQCIKQCRQAIEQDPSIFNFFINPFSLREVELRGFLLTDRIKGAERVASRVVVAGEASPTWRVIERVTMTQFYLAVGEMKAAESELRAAIFGAQELGLPHQVERAVRLAENAHLDDLVRMGKAAIEEMSDPL
ncbi:helix-turn-helix domain-containing protein [Streptomyces murinus]|uniref:Transcriptional regulator with XRE-family HTH domain n=2 Tax=Streptomyces murinus TaxID=33900 RepID=A0A7W3NNR9_STRMR|nr:helix-turn-helix transcriptional regulator [Streptomyces murinus]MBA9053929.1 transcriptional regulator with XRE-family HTH domain [Streptomyces murinus]UWW95000.1 helix-turn-helix domain-containing protein [Streptomyces murinus]